MATESFALSLIACSASRRDRVTPATPFSPNVLAVSNDLTSRHNTAGNALGRTLKERSMALAYVVALLRKLLRNCFDAMIEARALRRDMAHRCPHIEQ